MAKMILTDLDLNGNQVKNLVVDIRLSTPQSGVEGQIIYNNANKRLECYSDGEWQPLTSISTMQNYVDAQLNGDSLRHHNLN